MRKSDSVGVGGTTWALLAVFAPLLESSFTALLYLPGLLWRKDGEESVVCSTSLRFVVSAAFLTGGVRMGFCPRLCLSALPSAEFFDADCLCVSKIQFCSESVKATVGTLLRPAFREVLLCARQAGAEDEREKDERNERFHWFS